MGERIKRKLEEEFYNEQESCTVHIHACTKSSALRDKIYYLYINMVITRFNFCCSTILTKKLFELIVN